MTQTKALSHSSFTRAKDTYYKIPKGTEEKTQQLRALALFQSTRVQFPEPNMAAHKFRPLREHIQTQIEIKYKAY